MIGGGRPFLSEILGQPAPVGAKSPIFSLYSDVIWRIRVFMHVANVGLF